MKADKKEKMLQLSVERRNGGVYYRCIYPVVSYDIYLCAWHSLQWFVRYLNERQDTRRYRFVLLHRQCLLVVDIPQSIFEDKVSREQILETAQNKAEQTKETFQALADGMVPEDVRRKAQEEIEEMQKEW